MMTSIKVKFRPSTVDGKEGVLYFQIIHNRVVRQLNTDYKVFAEEWDAESESIVINGNRSNFLLGIQEQDAKQGIISRVPELKELSGNIDKATNNIVGSLSLLSIITLAIEIAFYVYFKWTE